METKKTLTTQRLDIVDALRGFALLAIILLHNLEHYNLYFTPVGSPDWLVALDKGLWDSTWFLMAGKAFSTFSLLFGFSYFIQMDNQQRRGKSFNLRFAWRMIILIIISQFHALFYNGDILLIYALMGLVLIPLSKLPNRWILIVASIMLLQPLEWVRSIGALMNPDFIPFDYGWLPYAYECKEVMKNGNLLETISSNITSGQLYGNLWQVSAGRLFQIPALFLFGLLAGRKRLFIKSDSSKRFWTTTAIISTLLLIFPLAILKNHIPTIIDNKFVLESYNNVILSIWNFTFMVTLIALFSLLWFYKGNGYQIQRTIIPFGRMSLTNYVLQSIIGCGIYLNWGCGLYEHTGATLSLIIGLSIFILQLCISHWWLSNHTQGPLEWIWKRLTWINNN